MLTTTLRTLWSHKRRLISTALSILLGVAFMAGTLVLSDTINKVFDDLFDTINEEIDVAVQGEELFDAQFGGGGAYRAKLPESLVADVGDVEGIEAASGYIAVYTATFLDSEGDTLTANGPPTILESWIEAPELNPLEVVEGHAPEADDQVALDRSSADTGGYEVGDEVTVLTQEGRLTYELVGLTTLGETDTAGGAIVGEFTLAEAQRLAGAPEQVDQIYGAGAEGTTPEELVERVRAVVPESDEVLTGEELSEQMADSVQEGLAFFTTLLLVFAAIALFVGTFIIYNTFSILVAQRTREMALLRAIGASRRQVLTSVLVEAGLIGLVAAFVGLLAGIGLAFLAIAGLDAVGVDLPDATLVVRPPTVVVAFVVGLVVTFLASIAPAIRATRVPPIAALQGVAIDRSSTSLFRRIAGPVIIVIGLVALLPAFGSDPSTDVLPTVGLGALLIFIGILVAGPVIARPLAAVVGSILPKIKGITGQLARENAIRNPKRTASTAAALMIGVALIGFITIFAASATASVESEVERGFRGEFVVQSTNSFSFTGVSPELATQLAEVDDVSSVASYRASEALITLPDDSDSGTFLGAVDPAAFGEVFEVRMAEGELTDLEAGGIIVDRQGAESNDLAIGDEVTVTFPGGATADVTIDAISDDQTMLGFWTMNIDDFGELAPEQYDLQVGLKLDDGADQEAVRADLETIVDEYPTVELLDRDEFVGVIAAQITALLNVIYALLALSIIIAFIGIANTLSLSIYERTRELGLLRAVGMSRGQLRSSIRWEAVIVALLGTVLGLLLGIGLSYTMVKALTAFGLGTFSFPVTSVIVIVVLGASLAVLASIGPARRAAKLQILDAIGAE